MALERDRTSIIMAIRPQYADAILNGSKTIEFRRRRIPESVDTVFIYATAPVSKIVGAFAISEQITASPQNLWSQFCDNGCIGSEQYFDYFEAAPNATGILIDNLICAPSPLSLCEAFGITRAPQSYQYVNSTRADYLLDLMRKQQVTNEVAIQ